MNPTKHRPPRPPRGMITNSATAPSVKQARVIMYVNRPSLQLLIVACTQTKGADNAVPFEFRLTERTPRTAWFLPGI